MKLKENKLLMFVLFFMTVGLLGGCATERSEFDKGYDLGSSDIAKRQYWAQVNLQKQKNILQQQGSNARYRNMSIPVYGKDQDGSNISEHYVNVRVIDR